jgi:hypothetical protein
MIDDRLAHLIRLDPDEARKAPTWRAAYSDRTAQLMAKLALLAYRPDAAMLEVELRRGGFSLLATYDRGVTQGFLALSDEFAVLSFRGSDSFDDWRTNLRGRASVLETSLGPVRVHGGFRAAFELVEAEVRADLDTRIPAKTGIYITGHSFGAAVAQIASAALERDTLAACYTYGAPRVGDLAFDQLVKCPHYRVVNGWDFVTTLPPPLMTPFRHSGDARLLTDLGKTPLRRDRNLAAKAVQNLLGLTLYFAGLDWLFSDHRLESYLEKLDAVLPLRGVDRLR